MTGLDGLFILVEVAIEICGDDMELQMKKLTIDLIDSFFDYFERIGFTDNKDFSMCYCLESHISAEEDEILDTKEKRQRKVTELINENKLSGYLVYDNQNLIGWCNADDKVNYEPIISSIALSN